MEKELAYLASLAVHGRIPNPEVQYSGPVYVTDNVSLAYNRLGDLCIYAGRKVSYNFEDAKKDHTRLFVVPPSRWHTVEFNENLNSNMVRATSTRDLFSVEEVYPNESEAEKYWYKVVRKNK